MMANALVDFWQDELTKSTQAATMDDPHRKDLQKAVDDAKQARAALTKTVDEKSAKLRSRRAALETAGSPAERTAINDEVAKLSIDLRSLQGDGLESDEAVAAASEDLDAYLSGLRRATVRKTAAAAALAAAQDAAKRRDATRKQLTDGLGTLVADATAALGSQPKLDAEAFVSEIPQELRDLAQRRLAVQRAWLDGRASSSSVYQLSMENATATDAPIDGVVARARATLARLDAAAQALGAGGARDLAAAKATLQSIADRKAAVVKGGPDLLTANERTAVAVNADRTDAIDKAKAVADAIEVVATAEAALEAEMAKQAALDPDAFPDQADVKAKQKALDDAKAALEQARTAFTQAERDVLNGWQAVVPDSAWATLADYLGAVRKLESIQALGGPGPEKLADDVAGGETALRDALQKSLGASRRNAVMKDLITSRAKRGDRARTAGDAFLLSALRGDID
jgi:hypothetical protein